MIVSLFCFGLGSLVPNDKVKTFAKNSLRGFWFNSWLMLVIQSYLDMLVPSTIQLLYYRQSPLYQLVSGLIVFVRLKIGLLYTAVPSVSCPASSQC